MAKSRVIILVLLSLCVFRVQGQVISVAAYGASGNGVQDDTTAIQAAIAATAALERPQLVFPPAESYLTTETILVPAGVAVEMHAPILFDGNDYTPALVLGEEGVFSENLIHILQVDKKDISDWNDEQSVGIIIHNAKTCQVTIQRVSGFTIGVQCVGSGQGFSYNQVELGLILNNHIGVDLTNYTSGSGAAGWCNENLFLGGRFGLWSDVHEGTSRYGVRITSQDEVAVTNNNNNFLKPSFELHNSSALPDGEAVPVLVEYGRQNYFGSCRNEANSAHFAVISNQSAENVFDSGFGPTPLVIETGEYPTSRSYGRERGIVEDPGTLIFESGSLVNLVGPYSGNQVQIPGMHVTGSGSTDIFVGLNNITINDESIEFDSSRAVGVFVDTSSLKRFVVRRSTEDGGEGRLRIRCHDADGNVLTDNSVNGNLYIKGGLTTGRYDWESTFRGNYAQNADSNKDQYFYVDDAVDHVTVMLAGGSNPIKLKSFAIYSVDPGHARAWSGYVEGIPGANLGVAIPTVGTWEKGRIVYNHDPDSGEAVGWICVQGGTPGTWKSMGAISP